eukprot:g43102.t1
MDILPESYKNFFLVSNAKPGNIHRLFWKRGPFQIQPRCSSSWHRAASINYPWEFGLSETGLELEPGPELQLTSPSLGTKCKAKELIIDFKKKGGEHAPIYNGAEVERVDSIKFLAVTIMTTCPGIP